eukprot:COSAG02_NODE_776_length_17302_cov_17.765855_3_plen_453_part_00
MALFTFVYSCAGIRAITDKAIANELRFYHDIAPTLTGVRTPVVYYSAADGAADTPDACWLWRPKSSVYLRTVLLLEDLSASGFESCGHACLDWETPLVGAVRDEAVRTMARLHAWGWGGRELQRETGLEGLTLGGHWATVSFGLKPVRKEQAMIDFIDTWSEVWPHLQEPDMQAMLFDFQVSSVLHPYTAMASVAPPEAGTKITENPCGCATWQANAHRWIDRVGEKDKRQTVLHGDFHRGNLFAKQNAADGSVECALFDWSFVGAGRCTWEMQYFLMAGGGGRLMTVEDEVALLATYHTALLETNPAVDYSLEQLKDDFKLQLFTSVAMLITDENSPDKLAEMEDMLEEGQRKPNVEASGAKQNSRTYEAWFRRLVEYHKDQSSWDDYFSGRPIPTAFAGRETEEVEARKAALQAKKNAKLEALRKTRLKKRREEEAKADGVMPPGHVGPT